MWCGSSSARSASSLARAAFPQLKKPRPCRHVEEGRRAPKEDERRRRRRREECLLEQDLRVLPCPIFSASVLRFFLEEELQRLCLERTRELKPKGYTFVQPKGARHVVEQPPLRGLADFIQRVLGVRPHTIKGCAYAQGGGGRLHPDTSRGVRLVVTFVVEEGETHLVDWVIQKRDA